MSAGHREDHHTGTVADGGCVEEGMLETIKDERNLLTVTASRPKGCTSVMARRLEPPDALDFFCTPPWATRAERTIIPGRLRMVVALRKECWRQSKMSGIC